MSAVAETQNPMKPLEQLINLTELVHHPDGDAELTDDARKALGEMKAVVEVLQADPCANSCKRCATCDEHFDNALRYLNDRRAALVPFGKAQP